MLQKMQDVFKMLILTSETCTTVLHLIQCIYYKTLLFKALDNIISLRSVSFLFQDRAGKRANGQKDCYCNGYECRLLITFKLIAGLKMFFCFISKCKNLPMDVNSAELSCGELSARRVASAASEAAARRERSPRMPLTTCASHANEVPANEPQYDTHFIT